MQGQIAQLVEPRHVQSEGLRFKSRSSKFFFVHPNLSKICTQSVSLVVYYMIFKYFIRQATCFPFSKKKIRLKTPVKWRKKGLTQKYFTQNVLGSYEMDPLDMPGRQNVGSPTPPPPPHASYLLHRFHPGIHLRICTGKKSGRLENP